MAIQSWLRDAGQGNPCPQWTTISWANWICMIWIWMIWILQWVPWLSCCFFFVFLFFVVVLRRFGVAMFFLFSWSSTDDGMMNFPTTATWEGIFGEAPQQRPCCTRDPLAMPCWIWNVKDYPKISQMFWSMSTKSLNGKGWFYTRLGILVGGTQKRCNLNAESNLMHIHQFSLMLSEKSQMGKKNCHFPSLKKTFGKGRGNFRDLQGRFPVVYPVFQVKMRTTRRALLHSRMLRPSTQSNLDHLRKTIWKTPPVGRWG